MNNKSSKKIAIIGAGQAGLLLAIGLIKHNYSVNLYCQHTPEQLLTGRIMSSQVLFSDALDFERDLALNFWDDKAPQNNFVSFNLVDTQNATKSLEWLGKTTEKFISIDQRIKFTKWLNEFKKLGGCIHHEEISPNDLENISSQHVLTIVATGKNKLNQIFQVNRYETVYEKPQRNLALLYVDNLIPSTPKSISINLLPEIGEYFCVEGTSHNGNCHMMLFEFLSNSSFDVWHKHSSNDLILKQAKDLLKRFLPWEYQRAENATLVDDKSILFGAITPTVRNPIHQLKNGNLIFGIGDAVLLNDPIAGQGANCATKAAKICLNQILSLKDDCDFNEKWMRNTWDLYWDTAKWSYYWSNILLEKPTSNVIELLVAAKKEPLLANKISNFFNKPIDAFPFVTNNKLTEAVIKNFLPDYSENKCVQKNQDIDLYNLNDKYLFEFKSSNIMQFIKSHKLKDQNVLDKFLSCIQCFSNHFQNMVMLRKIFTTDNHYCSFANQHLIEEFGHNLELESYRKSKVAFWDPILESTATWFTWKMMKADDVEKHVIMHMVLEASADIFFIEANKVMKKAGSTSYFSVHSEIDATHASLGKGLINLLDNDTKYKLKQVIDKAWSIMNIACDRIAEVSTIHDKVI